MDDKQMEAMFKGLMGSLGGNPDATKPGGEGAGMPDDTQMNEMMKQFTNFLQEGDQDDDFKGALGSVVKDIISKDSLYTPMKKLQDQFP